MNLIRRKNVKNLKIITDFKNNKLRCYFCNGNHLCRNCPLEQKLSPLLKKKVGDYMEHHVANILSCPSCGKKKLKVLGNNSPSLDIVCKNCKRRIEVKSKCLSVNNLPKDIKLPHGNFSDYNKRQKYGLDFIIVIYSVNRIKKQINIREVLYMNDNIIKNGNIVEVIKRPSSPLSTIMIKNRNSPKIKKLEINKKETNISFKKQIIEMINEHPKIEKLKINNKKTNISFKKHMIDMINEHPKKTKKESNFII